MEFSKESVEISNSSEVIAGYPAEVSVYNVYMMDQAELDDCFHEAEYLFQDSYEGLEDDLESFRDDSLICWYGDRCIPTVHEFREHPSVTLFLPNSLVHDDVMEKVTATDFAECVLEELDSYLERR